MPRAAPSADSAHRPDLLMGRFADVATLFRDGDDVTVAAREPGGPERVVVLLPESGAVRRTRRVLDVLAGVAIPGVVSTVQAGAGRSGLVLDVEPCGNLAERLDGLSPVERRSVLVRLMSGLARAHGRGYVHGALDAVRVVLDAAGEPWMLGWHAARTVEEAAAVDGFWPGEHDVRASACALGAGRGEGGPGAGAAGQSGSPAQRDFQRVLSRLAAPDPRDAYASADDVLRDLGEPLSLDPWESVAFVPRPQLVESVERGLAALDAVCAGGQAVCATFVVQGPRGSGRTRALGEICAHLRRREVLVLRASADGDPWGGLATLVVQMLQILGRDELAGGPHAAVLERVAAGSAAPEANDVAPAADGIVDLVRRVFADEPGALVLDDVDEMPPAACAVWRSVARRVAAGASRGASAAALFLASAVNLPEHADDDVARCVVALGEWGVPEVERFLSGVLEDEATARGCAPVLHALAGGYAGELVEVLRDL